MEPPIEGTENELNGEKPKCIELFVRHLTQSGYSPKTIKNYKQAILSLQRHYPGKILSELSNDEIQNFLQHCKGGTNYKNLVINSIKLFSDCVMKKRKIDSDILLISRPSSLPQTISFLPKSAVGTLLKQIKNKKHKSIVMLIYGCGLTVCDILRIRLENMYLNASGIYIADLPPGIIDRRVDLPVTLVEALTEYVDLFQPKIWLFEGQNPGRQYAERSIQNFIKKAAVQAKIEHPINATILRNSYAVHYLSDGAGGIEELQYSLSNKDKRVALKFADVAILKKNGHQMNPLDALYRKTE